MLTTTLRPSTIAACLALTMLLGGCGDAAETSASDTSNGSTNASNADTSGGGGSAPTNPNDDLLDFNDPTTDPPALAPELVVLTYVGGAGDQYARAATFDAEGVLTVEGEGWSVVWSVEDLEAGALGRLSGDASTVASEPAPRRPNLPGDPGRAYTDPRIGLDFTVGYRQAGNLQLPIFRAFEGDTRVWLLWGHPVASARDASLTADTRCYKAWGMPAGRIGVHCWTDGGNSVLARDPRDLSTGPDWVEGAWQRGTGGMSSLVALVDPADGGRVVSGTFLNAHVGHTTVDAWGRLYMARTATSRDGGDAPSDPFGLGAEGSAGLLVLDAQLQRPRLNARIGGVCADGDQYFSAIATRDRWVVLAGTTCAPELKTSNAIQPSAGGGQDGMIAIVRLW